MGFLGKLIGGAANQAKSTTISQTSSEVGRGISGGFSKITRGRSGSSNKKIKCPHCKKKYEGSDKKFCPHCGGPLKVNCSKCKAVYDYGTKFCTKCGTSLPK